MASTNRRATKSLGVLLGALAGAAILLASPAGAQTAGPNTSGGARATNDSVASGGCVATNDSVCSGSGVAVNDSTSSGSAVAVDGSVASGCSTAVDDSTASGGPCAPARAAAPATPGPAGTTGGGGTTTAARPAAATAGRSLALTGSPTGELAAAGAFSVLAGALLVRASRKEDTAARPA